MDIKDFRYTVAIRTLGTAGEKYQKLLNSIISQTIQPENINVYIAEGYEVPTETVGVETIYFTHKGMVTQRAQRYEEIKTDYILFCDDDLYLPTGFVEDLAKRLISNKADCIVANVYPQHDMSVAMKIASYFYNGTTPRRNDGWALKINKDASYSYNNQPQIETLPTMTGPGACFLCKKETFLNMHFEEETWLDSLPFASYEDQLCYYKMYLQHAKIFLAYNTGLIHLDARAAKRPDVTKKMFYKKKLQFVLWYRTIYNIRSSSPWQKSLNVCAFVWRLFVGIAAMIGDTIRYKKINFVWDYFLGTIKGICYVCSSDYKKVPSFDAHVEKS